MTVEIMRTGKKEIILDREKTGFADAVIEKAGYTWIEPLDIENLMSISLKGPDIHRLFTKSGKLYRFNCWLGEYPYKSLEIEEIGIIR